MRRASSSKGRPEWAALSSKEARRLMRVHGWTIRSLAQRWSITQRRVREVRTHGVPEGFNAANWRAMLTGFWYDGEPV